MKKLIALLVIALFLVSIVPVFAHEEDESVDEDRSERSHDLREDSDIDEDRSGRRGSLSNVRGLSEFGRSASDIEVEANASLRHTVLRERFAEAKERFKEAKEAFLSERASVKAKIADAKRACKDNEDSEECVNLREEAALEAKSYMSHAIDTIESVLEKRKSKIEELMARADASADVKARLQARLDKINLKLEHLSELRAEVEAATTKEEIKDAAKSLRREWKGIKKESDASSGDILSHRFSFAVKRAESLERKLERTLDRLESKGHDVSSVSAQVISFHSHIDKAAELAKEARVKFGQGKTEDDIKKGHSLLVEAHTELKLAHQDLKNIIRSLKINAGADGEAEVEAISEDSGNEESEEQEENDEHGSEVEVDAESETTVSN